MAPRRYTLGVDIGGTFTDLIVLADDGTLTTAKAATTPHDFAQGVLDAIRLAAGTLELSMRDLLGATDLIKHGSTVATNALITRRGVRVGLITTRGFEDTLAIGRAIARVDGLPAEEVRHVPFVTKPEPLVARELVRGVRERIDADGIVVVPLAEEDVHRAYDELVDDAGVDALAVSLLHAWREPRHERRIGEILRERDPDGRLHVTFGSELSGVAGEYARTNTAVADAFVGPIVQRYLANLEERLRDEGLAGRLLVMQGNGGLSGRAEASAISTLQSGPAGGMLASAHMSGTLSHRRVITTDMGGTSFDVGILDEGVWRYAEEPIFDRFRILQPIIDVVSIGAGGGTIARVEETTGRLLVGPESAGAAPGPVAYGAGGSLPTVTDADLVLGYLDPEYFLGGRRRLDRDAAEAAIEEHVGRPLGLSPLEAAAGIARIIDSKMADLIRREVVRSGYRPSSFVLYAFGGAGPVHAAGFARDLDIGEIHVFPTSAAFSAFGIAMADLMRTRLVTRDLPFPIDAEALDADLAALQADLAADLRDQAIGRDPSFRRFLTMRFRRQTSGEDVMLPWERVTADRMPELMELFIRRYEELYGRGTAYAEAGVDVSAIRVDAVAAVDKPPLRRLTSDGDGLGGNGHAPALADAARKGTRRAWFGTAAEEASVYELDRLRVGARIVGPSIVESPFTTVLVPPAWEAELDPYGGLVMRR